MNTKADSAMPRKGESQEKHEGVCLRRIDPNTGKLVGAPIVIGGAE